MVELPEILNIPEKLLPIIKDFNSYRYFLIEGGRGGGKSQAVGRLLLYIAEKKKIRIVCGRETQKSIAESVYSLLSDLVLKYNLNFEVFAQKITHRETNTDINFRGFREQGAFNIQGMEGIDVVWIDESQAITKETLDVLIPTIRKDKAKIFFTMNRHVHDDPVFETFISRKDCLHIHLDYFDNPFCTQALINEANECKIKSEADYNHIWLGQPLSQSEDAVFGHDELQRTKLAKYPARPGYGLKIAGFDIARFGDDKCAVVILQQMGSLHWEVVHVDQWDHRDLNFTTGNILTIHNENNVDTSIIDTDGGYGAGPFDSLTKGRGLDCFVEFNNPPLSYEKNKSYGNNRTANTYKLKDMILKGHICIPQEELLDELETLRYQYDNYQRKILISKDTMRSKYKVKSPNMADGLIMATSLVGEIKARQDNQYSPMYHKKQTDNLFAIAGIR